DFNGFTSKLSKYSIVKPQVINNRWTRSINRTSQTKETYGEKASYTLKINNREHILHLQKNRYKLITVTDIVGSVASSY
ncbi:hypothetical protein XENOCAPTIV_025490, partial [Xenoophorus captivus]